MHENEQFPEWFKLANKSYQKYYINLSESKKEIINNQANSRNLNDSESINKFLATRIFESDNINKKQFKIPRFNNNNLNENDNVIKAMNILR